MDGEYPLRLVATLNAKPDENETTDFLLKVIYDSCYGTVVQSNALPDYEYNIDEGNSETIAALAWTQTKADCQAYIEYTWTMQDETHLDTDIFTISDNTLNIQSSDKEAAGTYHLKVTAKVSGYPDSETTQDFTVELIQPCSDSVIISTTIESQQYEISQD